MLTFTLKGFKNVWMLNNLKFQKESIKSFTPLVSQSLRFSFSTLKRSDRQSSESLLKQYFSSRLTLSTSQLGGFIVQLSKNNDVKIRDHRWESLYMTIQKYHKDFSLESKIEIIQALGRMKQNNQLFLTLYKNIVAEFHKLTLEQMAVLLWSMVKAQQNDKNIVLTIYKKIHKILQNDEKVKLYKSGEQPLLLSYQSLNLSANEEEQIIHHIHESYFVQLIWAIQKTKTIDEKLILDLLKFTFKEQTFNNLEKLRIQNLCLLAYSMEELKMQKYRISQTIINQIIKSWQQLQKLNFLTLNLLSVSFSKFVHYQQQYLTQYGSKLSPQDILKKQDFILKQRNFILLIVETIFLRQNRSINSNSNQNKGRRRFRRNHDGDDELQTLENPLSSKFASQIILQLGKLNLYEKSIWYKLLSSITDDVDKAEIQDLSMALTGICKLETKEIPSQQVRIVIYNHKKILCRRVFQIYTSLTGKSLQNIKELVFKNKIENQLVPSRIRRQIEKQLQALRMEQNSQESQQSNEKSAQKQALSNQQGSQVKQKREPKPSNNKTLKREKSSPKKDRLRRDQEKVAEQSH